MMKRSLKWSALALAMTLPMAAQAHKMWMVPSATNVSGADPWVTVDAAVSNDLFYADHVPVQTDRVVVTAPDGPVSVTPENAISSPSEKSSVSSFGEAALAEAAGSLCSRCAWAKAGEAAARTRAAERMKRFMMAWSLHRHGH